LKKSDFLQETHTAKAATEKWSEEDKQDPLKVEFNMFTPLLKKVFTAEGPARAFWTLQ